MRFSVGGLVGCVALVFGLTVTPVLAQSGGLAKQDMPVKMDLTARKVVTDDKGKETLSAAQQARPGDVISYSLSVANTGKDVVSKFAPTIPVPAGMELVAGSAKPAPSHASLDGRQFESFPIKRKVTLPNGKVEEREVPASQYRAVRWSQDRLAAGAASQFSLRARLTQPATAAEGVSSGAGKS